MAGESDEELEEMMEEIRRQMRAEQSQPESRLPSWPSQQLRMELMEWTCCGNCQHATWQQTDLGMMAWCELTHLHQASSAKKSATVRQCQAMKPWPIINPGSQTQN